MPETEREQEPRKRAGGYVSLLVSLIVGLVSAGVGFSLPIVFPGLLGHEPAEATSETLHTAFVPFGDIVVNLNEGRMNRYLRLSITLQVQGPEGIEETLTKSLESKKAILNSWLLAYLADMTMDDIRGAAGQNRLRREIHDHFSQILFPDGHGEIQDLLFEEFTVQ